MTEQLLNCSTARDGATTHHSQSNNSRSGYLTSTRNYTTSKGAKPHDDDYNDFGEMNNGIMMKQTIEYKAEHITDVIDDNTPTTFNDKQALTYSKENLPPLA